MSLSAVPPGTPRPAHAPFSYAISGENTVSKRVEALPWAWDALAGVRCTFEVSRERRLLAALREFTKGTKQLSRVEVALAAVATIRDAGDTGDAADARPQAPDQLDVLRVVVDYAVGLARRSDRDDAARLFRELLRAPPSSAPAPPFTPAEVNKSLREAVSDAAGNPKAGARLRHFIRVVADLDVAVAEDVLAFARAPPALPRRGRFGPKLPRWLVDAVRPAAEFCAERAAAVVALASTIAGIDAAAAAEEQQAPSDPVYWVREAGSDEFVRIPKLE